MQNNEIVYVDINSFSPYINFALEYYLIFEKKLPYKSVFLFWQTEPTLMLGKYQNVYEEINLDYVKEHNMNVVRRITGGGTIFTDLGGFQFSFINYDSDKPISFTRYITPIINALNKLGVNASFNGRNDVVIDNKKFSGNAQFKHKNITLHHGSILYDTNIEQMVKSTTVDNYKIISKSIKSVRDRVTNIKDHLKTPLSIKQFKDEMVSSILGDKNNIYSLTDEDIKRINEIAKEKFDNRKIIYSDNPKFKISKVSRFDGGKVEICLDVVHGKIKDIAIFGDFFASFDTLDFKNNLIGCEYEKESLRYALLKFLDKNSIYKISIDDLLNAII